MNKLLSVFMDYYSAMKRNELLINTAAWMNLTCFIPSERSKIQKFTCCQIPFTCHSVKNKTIAMEDRSVFFRDGVGRISL